ncbi:MAG: DUF4249 family protein [Melioribacter sp.]|uniref:DUF4249 family protein n=1 Tax=Melioribacter sp. TaxID=2052167 RepID=UPI003BE58223
MKKYLFAILSLLLVMCGEGTVEIGSGQYKPKIVVEGYIIPGNPIKGIRITRNFPINTQPNPFSLILKNAEVKITELETGKTEILTYNDSTFSFEGALNFIVDYDKSYRLTIEADIDGKRLKASSTTTTPAKGFEVIREESILDSMKYRQTGADGKVNNFKVVFKPSPGTGFYVFSIVALDASYSSFIYENPYIEIDSSDLDESFDNFRNQLKWLQFVNSSAEKIEYNIEWLDTWFYGRYRLIIYAGDENFRRFLLTHGSVQDPDGNFHEPLMNFEGEAIGVFGSYQADTLYFKVLK